MDKDLLADFIKKDGASDEAILVAEKELRCVIPSDYKEFLRGSNGGEGFIGKNYLILWSAEELGPFNDGYEVQKYANGLVLFGSDGGGEAYAFDLRSTTAAVLQIPFIGMSLEDALPTAGNFNEFMELLRGAMMSGYVSLRLIDPDLIGKEIMEIKPILLGGDPVDPKNKMILTRQQHIEIVRCWNGVIQNMRNNRGK